MDSEKILGERVKGFFNVIIKDVGSMKVEASSEGDSLSELVANAHTLLTAKEFIGQTSDFFYVISFSLKEKRIVVKRKSETR